MKKSKKSKNRKIQPPPIMNFPSKAQLRTLRDLNGKGALAIFLGAGISASCGLPDWNQLLFYLKKELNKHNVYVSEEEDVAEISRKIFGEKNLIQS